MQKLRTSIAGISDVSGVNTRGLPARPWIAKPLLLRL
jgi:hypothetical protein